jgi:MFS family permease
MIPGSAPTPHHVPWLRIAYGVVGVSTSLTGALGNAIYTVNLPGMQGALGLDPTEGAWLTAVYVMANACASMLLFKVRQQFGLRLFAELGVGFYVCLMLSAVFSQSFASVLLVRAASGFAGSALSSLGFIYILQSMPQPHRTKAMVLALAMPSLAIPLVRLFSPVLLDLSLWHGLYVFQLGLALWCFAGVVLLELPPSDKVKAFEPLDLVSFVLVAGGFALVCAVLALARIVWWTEAAWIGWALCGAVALFTAAFLIEHHRRNPLLNTRWFANGDILRLALVSLLIRFVLSEQSYGAIGLLQNAGLNNEQMDTLSLTMLLAMIGGIVVSAFTFKPPRFAPPLLVASLLIAAGSFLDTRATSQTRADSLYLSQGLLAFATVLFTAPAML